VQLEEEEGEAEQYWNNASATRLLSRLLKENDGAIRSELVPRLVAAFQNHFLYWAQKSSNASYLIRDILLLADKKTQEKIAKELAKCDPKTRIGRTLLEIKEIK